MFKYFDAHSHIHGNEFDEDREEVLKRMRNAKVSTIAVGTHLESSQEAVLLAEKENDVWATVGLHPTDTKEDFLTEEYKKLANNKKVVAIGECGLDYFWEKDSANKEKQKEKFSAQVELAILLDKPLMIHSRPTPKTMDAYEDVLKIINSDFHSKKSSLSGNVHFFAGNDRIAKNFLDLGFTLSFTGVITFARDYDEVIKFIPIESILSETDSPYVTPEPYRGKRNEPMYVTEVVRKIAKIKDFPENEAAKVIIENAERVFKIDLKNL